MYAEAHALRKILLYSVIAVVTGLLVMLVPLVTFVELNVGAHFASNEILPKGLRDIEGSYGSGGAKLSVSDFEVLITSFVIATAVYLLVRRKV